MNRCFDQPTQYLYHRVTLVTHPDGDWLLIPTSRGRYFAFVALNPDGDELHDSPNVYQTIEGAISVGKAFVACTMAKLVAGEWRV